MKNRVYIYTSIILSLVFLATFFYFNNDGFFISGNTVNSKSLSQDSENARISSCNNECSIDSCQGFFHTGCLNVSICMKKQERSITIGKCEVQCLKNQDCDQGQLCQNYKCNKIIINNEMEYIASLNCTGNMAIWINESVIEFKDKYKCKNLSKKDVERVNVSVVTPSDSLTGSLGEIITACATDNPAEVGMPCP